MRATALPLPLLLLLLPVLGCGGGGGSDDGSDEVVLATWPLRVDATSSDLFARVTLGLAATRGSALLEETVLLAEVVDGTVGLQDRVEASDAGAPFLEVVDRLTDGADSLLATTVDLGPTSGATFALESEALDAFVFASPDLRGSIVTALRLDLAVTRIEQGPIAPEEKQGGGRGAIVTGTTVEIRGDIRILGIAGPTEE